MSPLDHMAQTYIIYAHGHAKGDSRMSDLTLNMVKSELGRAGYEVSNVKQKDDGRTLLVEANALVPVIRSASTQIYAPVPVEISVTLNAQDQIESIHGGKPEPAFVEDAVQTVKTLIENHQLAGLPVEGNQ